MLAYALRARPFLLGLSRLRKGRRDLSISCDWARATSLPSIGEMQTISFTEGHSFEGWRSGSDDLEVARKLPIGDGFAKFTLLPLRVMA